MRFISILAGGFVLGWVGHLMFSHRTITENDVESHDDRFLSELHDFAHSEVWKWRQANSRPPTEEFFKTHALNLDEFLAGTVLEPYEATARFGTEEHDYRRRRSEEGEIRVHVWWSHRVMPGSGREYIFWKESGELRGIRFHKGA